jgi:tellurite resistance protein TerC
VGGWLIVAVGIVLIPLPGQGWLIVGLAPVLSREVGGRGVGPAGAVHAPARDADLSADSSPGNEGAHRDPPPPGASRWYPPSSASSMAAVGRLPRLVAAMLARPGVFHRKAHAVSLREAATWSAVWIGLAGLFAGGAFWFAGPTLGMELTTGYLIEKALSIDNIFVMVILFAAFGVPDRQQHRVLFWGIIGALVMRAIFIFAGTALIARFEWTIYVFGAFLVITGIRMLRAGGEQSHPENNPLIRLARKVLPVAPGPQPEHFFVRVDGRRMVTPLFLALVAVEITDLIFAVDSIPAILAVSREPFIVFTSNIFAILGLRSLYFLLAGVVQKFRYLKIGLAGVLVFVGLKMMLVDVFHIPVGISLGVVALLIAGSIGASLLAVARAHGEERTVPS